MVHGTGYKYRLFFIWKLILLLLLLLLLHEMLVGLVDFITISIQLKRDQILLFTCSSLLVCEAFEPDNKFALHIFYNIR